MEEAGSSDVDAEIIEEEQGPINVKFDHEDEEVAIIGEGATGGEVDDEDQTALSDLINRMEKVITLGAARRSTMIKEAVETAEALKKPRKSQKVAAPRRKTASDEPEKKKRPPKKRSIAVEMELAEQKRAESDLMIRWREF